MIRIRVVDGAPRSARSNDYPHACMCARAHVAACTSSVVCDPSESALAVSMAEFSLRFAIRPIQLHLNQRTQRISILDPFQITLSSSVMLLSSRPDVANAGAHDQAMFGTTGNHMPTRPDVANTGAHDQAIFGTTGNHIAAGAPFAYNSAHMLHPDVR